MAYALFAQRKVELTGYLNNLQLQQTQRSDEQQALATDTLSLQQQMSSLQVSQSNAMANKYRELANVGNDGGPVKITLENQSEYYDYWFNKYNDNLDWGDYVWKGEDDVYDDMQTVVERKQEYYNQKYEKDIQQKRSSIDADIKELEAANKRDIDAINRQIYLVSVKENTVEMAVKRLDTAVTTVQKQLEAIEEAEGKGIENATPEFKGIG